MKLACVGAVDIEAPALVGALEAVVTERYALQWRPGLGHDAFGGAPMHIKWLHWARQGTWVVLPPRPHGRALALALAARVQRPLTLLETERFDDGTRLTRYTISPGGEWSMESVEDHSDLPPEDVLHEALGTLELRADLEHAFPVYPLTAAEPVSSEPDPVPIQASQLQDVRILIEHGTHCTLIREGPDRYLFKAMAKGSVLSSLHSSGDLKFDPDRVSESNIYLNITTGQAVEAALSHAQVAPSVWGPLKN